MKSKRFRLILGGIFGLLVLFAAFTALRLPGLFTEQLTQKLHLRVARPATWSGFLQVTLGGIELPNPAGAGRPPVISIRSATARVPAWALLMRPLPIELELDTPRVTLDVELGDSLLREVDFLPTGEAWQTAEESQQAAGKFSKINPRAFTVIPMGLKIREGRIEVTDVKIRPDGPLYTIDHIRMDLWMTSPLKYPAIHLDLAAQFVTEEGKPVGSLSAVCEAGATLQQMEGKVEIWHDRLADFRLIYQRSPEPFTFEDGAGGPVILWEYKDGWIKASMRSRTKNLRVGGTVAGGVPWQSVLDAVADPNGEIDLTVAVEGVWGEPGFDVHNRLLSELDWAMKERAAAKGVRVPGRIFYGLLI